MAIDCRYGVKQGPRSGFFALWHQSNNRLNTFDWPARRHRVTSKEDQVPRPSPNSDRDSPESLLDKIQSDHFEITLSPSAQNHGHVEIQGKGLLISTVAHIVPITIQIHSIASSHAKQWDERPCRGPYL
jgi:hypothetical protein